MKKQFVQAICGILGLLFLSTPMAIATNNSDRALLSDLQNPDVVVRRAAAEKLAQTVVSDFKNVLPKLTASLKDPDPEVRYYIAVSLTAQGFSSEEYAITLKAAVPALIEALRDNDHRVRAWSANAILTVMPHPPQVAAEPLIELLADPSPEVRRMALAAVGSFRPVTPRLLHVVLNATRDAQNDSLRDEAKTALRGFISADPSVIPRVIENLDRESPPVKLTIIQALGRAGKKAESVVTMLQRIAGDPQETQAVRHGAKEALQNMGAK